MRIMYNINNNRVMVKFFTSFLIFTLMFLLMNCDDTTSTVDETDPVIDSLNLHYVISSASFYIGAQISDPQGYETIDEVKYSLYYGETDSTGEELLHEGLLVDDGKQGDIIISDGVFSRKHFNMNEGVYRCVVLADDEDGNLAETVTKIEYAVANQAPVIYMNDYSSEFEKGEWLFFKVKATDPQGMDDITGISFTIEYPDGELKTHSSWVLRDDGQLGDDEKNDGIYSIRMPTNEQSVFQGLWNFRFTAKDKGGLYSNVIKAVVKNPGVHVTNPDETSNYNIGDSLSIEWESVFIDTLVIEYTLNSNTSSAEYIGIDTVAADTRLYKWKIPGGSNSDHCMLNLDSTRKKFWV